MPTSKPNPLRNIAENEIDSCFRDLPPTTRNELVVSLVRQLLTNNGTAVIVTPEREIWFHLTPREDGGKRLVRHSVPGTFVALMHKNRVLEEQIPALLHELNKCQCVRCITDYGQMLQLRVDPGQRRFHIEMVPDLEAQEPPDSKIA